MAILALWKRTFLPDMMGWGKSQLNPLSDLFFFNNCIFKRLRIGGMEKLELLGLMIWAGTAGWLLARWMAGFFCLLAICACVCGLLSSLHTRMQAE